MGSPDVKSSGRELRTDDVILFWFEDLELGFPLSITNSRAGLVPGALQSPFPSSCVLLWEQMLLETAPATGRSP